MKKMKISNLFHWLYGALMLAPIFAVASGILVNVFNKDLTNDVQVNYKYETNEVNDFSDVVVGNAYRMYWDFGSTNFIDDSIINPNDYSGAFEFYILENDIDYTFYYVDLDETIYGETMKFNSSLSGAYIRVVYEDYFVWSGIRFYMYDSDVADFVVDYYFENIEMNDNPSHCYFDFVAVDIDSFDINFDYGFSIVPCPNIPIESVDISESDTSNIFYKSIDNMKESVLFNWASESFLSSPFRYITDLFGMPSENVTTQLLSYWCSISIIWLVFDIVMFIPLLVHSWIDKGGIE